MRESPPLTEAELAAARKHFAENPWIGKTHLGKMSAAVNPAAALARPAKAVTKIVQ